jgi:predicted dehydrogenase
MAGRNGQRTGPVRFGLLGCGELACGHLIPALAKVPGANLVALADPRREARERGAGIAGTEAFASSERVLGRGDIDAIVISTDPGEHARLAVEVAAAGKDLYLEPPLAPTGPIARDVADAVAASGVAAAVGFDRRYHPLYERTRELVRSGAVGEVRQVRTRYDRPLPTTALRWRRRRESGGGALLDLGARHLDLAGWLLDDELDAIETAAIGSERSEGDRARLAARTTGGVRLEAEFSYLGPAACAWSIRGERGVIVVDVRARSLRVVPRGHRDRGAWLRRLQTRLLGLPGVRSEPSHARALRAFVESLGGAGAEVPTLEDGLRSLELVRRVEAAAD